MSYKIKYFSTDWCGPCKMFKPIVLESVAKFTTAIQLEFIDVDSDRDQSVSYKVISVPTLVYLKDEVEIFKTVGYMNKVRFEDKLRELVTYK